LHKSAQLVRRDSRENWMHTTSDLLLQFPLERPVDALLAAPGHTIEPVPGGTSAPVVDDPLHDRAFADGHGRFVAAAFGGGVAIGAIVMWLADVVPHRPGDSSGSHVSVAAPPPPAAAKPEPPPADVTAAVPAHHVAPGAAPSRRRQRPPVRTRRSRPAIAQSTVLTVTSAPSGAQVTVDGIGWGHTPVTIHHLPSGPKVIRVTKEGYESQQRTISVPDDRPSAAVRVTLRARTGQASGPRSDFARD
jgi:hypothetical protein